MEYEENIEYKNLIKEKKYKEAAEIINYEIAVNLLRVHNLYSDVKYDVEEKEYIAYGSQLYAKNSNGEIISEMKKFLVLSVELGQNDIGIEISKFDEIEYFNFKESLKLRKKVMKLFKKNILTKQKLKS